ncbi:MAG TPA: hypothetical protein VGB53_06890 [Rubricoccaceae bacterium]
MTPLRILFAGLVIVGTMLYVLNPGPEAFEAFLRMDRAERAEAAQRAADSTITGTSRTFLADRVGREVSGPATIPFDRTDYHVASLYRVDDNADRAGGEWTYLGLANWFVAIEQPEAAVPAATRRGAPPARRRPPGIPG